MESHYTRSCQTSCKRTRNDCLFTGLLYFLVLTCLWYLVSITVMIWLLSFSVRYQNLDRITVMCRVRISRRPPHTPWLRLYELSLVYSLSRLYSTAILMSFYWFCPHECSAQRLLADQAVKEDNKHTSFTDIIILSNVLNNSKRYVSPRNYARPRGHPRYYTSNNQPYS